MMGFRDHWIDCRMLGLRIGPGVGLRPLLDLFETWTRALNCVMPPDMDLPAFIVRSLRLGYQDQRLKGGLSG